MKRIVYKLIIIALLIFVLAGCADNPLLVIIRARANWDPAYTYRKDESTIEYGQAYKSLQDGNTGNEPVISPAWWETK